MKIYLRNYSENNELLYSMKGFRNDVFVEIDNPIYNLFLIEQSRFIQETEQSIKDEGYCSIEPNTIVIDSIDKDNVIARCVQIGAGVFCCMRPCKQCNDKISLNLSKAVKKRRIAKQDGKLTLIKKS